MKVKEINRTANVAWSPSQQYPIYIAAGTAAQQLDATFSTTAALEIFHLDFNNHEIEMPLVGSLPCEHRFNKLIWGNYGIVEEEYKSGVVIGGTDKGDILVVDASKIISGSTDDPVVQSINQHTGPVHGLDINPFQTNLLASGGTGSEIYVLDLKNPSTPLSPGNKSLQPDVITCVSWNKTVQHILGTASPGTGKVIVWDLRKNEPVIKVGDASSLMRCKSMAWHPEVATQMVIANEDDRYPVIQMWDLRFATSPMKIFEGHQRGVLSLAWCAQDPDLLMSCGKDNRILCFNPNSDIPGGEILYELQTSSQWTFDVLWCPRNPGLISTTSFDGHVTVNSLLGGGTAPHTTQDQVMDAFGDADIASLPAHLQQQRQQQQQQHQRSEPLKKTPKWMKKPCAARFGFGGKLISFGNFTEAPAKQIYVSQVITEEEFLNRSVTLENALLAGQFVEFCDHKISTAKDPMDKSLWSFLKVNFDKEPRLRFLDLLGYNPQELAKKICALTSTPKSPSGSRDSAVDAKELASKMELLSATGDHLLKADGSLFSSGSVSPAGAGTKTPASDNEGAAAFDAIAATGVIPPVGSADPANDEGRPASPLTISTEDDTDGLVSQSLLTGNFEAAVDVCFKANRMADALLLGIAGGPELFTRTQNRYLEQAKTAVSRLISSVVNRDWRCIVETCAIDSWREALAALITYAKAEEFSDLCDVLGERLETEDRQYSSAMVCYICGGNVERMVACWSRSIKQEPSALTLQDLVEKLMILKKAVEREKKDTVNAPDSYLSKQISNYANILASQGCYQTAMVYLSTVNDPSVAVLKDRVFRAQNVNQAGVAAPEAPFGKVEILASPARNLLEEKVQPLQRQMARTGAPYQSQFAPPSQGPQLFDPPNVPQNPIQPSRPNYAAPPQPGYISSSPNVPTPPASISGQAIFTPAQPSPLQTQPTYQPVASQGYGLYNPVAPAPVPAALPPLSGDGFINALTISAPVSNFTPTSAGQRPNLPNLYNPSAMHNNFGGPAIPQGPPLSTHMQATPMPPMQPQPSTGLPPPTGPPTAYGMMDTGAPAVGPPPGKFAPGFHHLARESPTQAQPQPLPAGMFVPNQTQIPPEEKKLPPEPEPKNVIKPPIPSEHMIVQEVFNAIVDRCKSTVNNPQTKRKLEEVTRRLEILYDMLRDSKLSPSVLGGLHQMVDACKVSDYPTGLQIHTQMVASGNFSEISSFMSGLKTLMQVATQLHV